VRSFRIQTTVRGHHVYKEVWSPRVGEELAVHCESGNNHDPFAVAVWKDDTIVGHVPREISRVCWFFLQNSVSEIACQVDGNRQ
jgi:hypothetical protein